MSEVDEIVGALDELLTGILKPRKAKALYTDNLLGEPCASVGELASVNRCTELKAATWAMSHADGPLYDDAVRYIKSLHPSPHSSGDGVMVCLVPDWNTRKQLAIEDGDDPGQLHCTLYYAGKTSGETQVSASQISRLKEAAHEIARWAGGPITAQANGITRFSSSGDEDDPIVVSIDSPKLPRLYHALMQQLFRNGDHNFREPDHGFTPHITLGYIDQEEPMPIDRWIPREVKFRDIEVWVAGQIFSWCLGAVTDPFEPGMYDEPSDTEPQEVPRDEEGAIPEQQISFKDVTTGGSGLPHNLGKRKRTHRPELIERVHRIRGARSWLN